jgi:hypothetical protein
MRKLDEIRQLCDETIADYKELCNEYGVGSESTWPEQHRAELAEQILEILNGEKK